MQNFPKKFMFNILSAAAAQKAPIPILLMINVRLNLTHVKIKTHNQDPPRTIRPDS